MGGGEEQGDPNLPYFAFPVPASLCNGITKGDKGCELQKKIGRVCVGREGYHGDPGLPPIAL